MSAKRSTLGLQATNIGLSSHSAVRRIQDGDYIGGALDLISAGVSTRRMFQACFTGEMPILVEHGSKRADEIVEGDLLWSQDEFDAAGELALQRVEEIFVRVSPVINLHINGRIIRTTAEHPFYVVNRGWIPAGELQSGDVLQSHDKHHVHVEGVADSGEVTTVYNFRVAEYHTYFVGTAEWGFSVWTHNAEYGSNQAKKAAKGIKLSATAPDLVVKGQHIHLNKIELKVLPGNWGTIVLKPVFSSQAKIAGPAISKAQMALNDPQFLARLHASTARALEFVRTSNLPNSTGKAAEFKFLLSAIEKRIQ